mmetsp:Transcript_31571/g.51072  ORF Transcript_31571/g.51072 Transcript_31571/m.51072 type:complete len:110 (-) Transcript_31571:959-1288(-)
MTLNALDPVLLMYVPMASDATSECVGLPRLVSKLLFTLLFLLLCLLPGDDAPCTSGKAPLFGDLDDGRGSLKDREVMDSVCLPETRDNGELGELGEESTTFDRNSWAVL